MNRPLCVAIGLPAVIIAIFVPALTGAVTEASACQGKKGVCQVNLCARRDGHSWTGLCGASSSEYCCIPRSRQRERGCVYEADGYCVNVAEGGCSDNRLWPSLCGVDDAKQCCVPSSKPSDKRCMDAGGRCMVGGCGSGTALSAGMCGADLTRQCCVRDFQSGDDVCVYENHGRCIRNDTSKCFNGRKRAGMCAGNGDCCILKTNKKLRPKKVVMYISVDIALNETSVSWSMEVVPCTTVGDETTTVGVEITTSPVETTTVGDETTTPTGVTIDDEIITTVPPATPETSAPGIMTMRRRLLQVVEPARPASRRGGPSRDEMARLLRFARRILNDIESAADATADGCITLAETISFFAESCGTSVASVEQLIEMFHRSDVSPRDNCVTSEELFADLMYDFLLDPTELLPLLE